MYYNTITEYLDDNLKEARSVISTLPKKNKEIITDVLDWLAWNYEESMHTGKLVEEATINVVGNETYAEIMREFMHLLHAEMSGNYEVKSDD